MVLARHMVRACQGRAALTDAAAAAATQPHISLCLLALCLLHHRQALSVQWFAGHMMTSVRPHITLSIFKKPKLVSNAVPQAMSGAGGQVDHLGSMLLSFLQRYGVDFDRARQAVAVKRGGFVSKASLGGDFGRKGILSLEDPLTGEGWVQCVLSTWYAVGQGLSKGAVDVCH